MVKLAIQSSINNKVQTCDRHSHYLFKFRYFNLYFLFSYFSLNCDELKNIGHKFHLNFTHILYDSQQFDELQFVFIFAFIQVSRAVFIIVGLSDGQKAVTYNLMSEEMNKCIKAVLKGMDNPADLKDKLKSK